MGCCPDAGYLALVRLGVLPQALEHPVPERLELPLALPEQRPQASLVQVPLQQAWLPGVDLGLQLPALRRLASGRLDGRHPGWLLLALERRQAWLRRRWNLGMRRAACALPEAQRWRTPSERTRPCPAIWLVLLSK